MWEADLAGGVALVFGAEGKGVRPLVRRACDDAVSIPLAGRGRVAQRQRRRSAAALRGRGSERAAMAEPTLYLFDGYNLLHAGGFADAARARDALASFVALRGARGVVVFDGAGSDAGSARWTMRYAPNADALLERLAAEHRAHERVCLVSSDVAVRGTSGQEVQQALSSRDFLRELEQAEPRERADAGSRSRDRLDAATRARLERLRRGDVALIDEHTFRAD